MRTVDNPKKLFRKFDATDVDEDSSSHEFKVGTAEGADSEPQPLSETIQKNSISLRKMTVEFEDLSDPADDFHASLDAIEQAATEVADASQVPDNVDTKFTTQENGDFAVYMADTDHMGYEVIKSENDPRFAGYIVLDEDAIVKVKP